ncbi:hypothetical protein [Halanaerobium salsuginis]|uniref:Membrane protein YesL n=1 Tax=Halanaerobium salsuginis TaxID=29563 RepID=A0A1I4J2A4_9FIRM|nr:hypothetical protein [Halanaerobium salsuginis]SFL60186.1 hypothetical protein SAMN02983006_01562 [Halanaerobium salsuginis]
MEIFSVLKFTFKKYYEHLFKLVFVGLSWFILTSILLFVGFFALSTGAYPFLILPIVLIGPLLLTGLEAVHLVINQESAGFKKLISYFKSKFWRGFLVFLVTALIYLIFIVDLRFFLVRGQENTWLLAFAFLFAYLVIYFSIYQAYLWGLLIVQSEQSIKNILKNALVISLDNLLFSLLWLLALVILAGLLIVTGIGLPLAFMGILGILLIKGCQEMLAKY